jgi:hypothetical protein
MGGEVAITGFVGRAGARIAGLAGESSFSGLSEASFLRTGQAARISTSARFMFIAAATNCRWQALRASPR